MEWLFGEKLSDHNIIERIEQAIDYQFPLEFKDLVRENNNAYPQYIVFDTKETEGRVLNNLLSLEKGTLKAVLNGKKRWDISGLKWRYIPFGRDPFGGYICFDRETDHVVFFDHETRRIEEVADSFTEFIDSLYDDGFVPFDQQ